MRINPPFDIRDRNTGLVNPILGTNNANNIHLTSNTLCVTSKKWLVTWGDTFNTYIVNSLSRNKNPESHYIIPTAIEWPDPPSLSDMLEVAKNYVLAPSVSASIDLLTSGPEGAITAGMSTIASQIAHDIQSMSISGADKNENSEVPSDGPTAP